MPNQMFYVVRRPLDKTAHPWKLIQLQSIVEIEAEILSGNVGNIVGLFLEAKTAENMARYLIEHLQANGPEPR